MTANIDVPILGNLEVILFGNFMQKVFKNDIVSVS